MWSTFNGSGGTGGSSSKSKSLRIDARQIQRESYCWWLKSCTTKDDDYPIIYRVLTIPGGAGFCPSTVWQRFWFGKKIQGILRKPKNVQNMAKKEHLRGPSHLRSAFLKRVLLHTFSGARKYIQKNTPFWWSLRGLMLLGCAYGSGNHRGIYWIRISIRADKSISLHHLKLIQSKLRQHFATWCNRVIVQEVRLTEEILWDV